MSVDEVLALVANHYASPHPDGAGTDPSLQLSRQERVVIRSMALRTVADTVLVKRASRVHDTVVSGRLPPKSNKYEHASWQGLQKWIAGARHRDELLVHPGFFHPNGTPDHPEVQKSYDHLRTHVGADADAGNVHFATALVHHIAGRSLCLYFLEKFCTRKQSRKPTQKTMTHDNERLREWLCRDDARVLKVQKGQYALEREDPVPLMVNVGLDVDQTVSRTLLKKIVSRHLQCVANKISRETPNYQLRREDLQHMLKVQSGQQAPALDGGGHCVYPKDYWVGKIPEHVFASLPFKWHSELNNGDPDGVAYGLYDLHLHEFVKKHAQNVFPNYEWPPNKIGKGKQAQVIVTALQELLGRAWPEDEDDGSEEETKKTPAGCDSVRDPIAKSAPKRKRVSFAASPNVYERRRLA